MHDCITETGNVGLVVISDLEYGGAQRQAVELCNHMDPKRFTMHICSLSEYVPLADSLHQKEGRFHQVQRRSRFDWTVVVRLARLIRRIKAQVVHCFLFDAEIAGRLAGRLTRTVVISSERNTDYSIKKLDRMAYRFTRWARDLTIANSSAGADFNSRLFNLPRESYRVVHNGVDTIRFQPRDGRAMRAKLGIAETEQLVGVFGSFKPQKNHGMLLKAAPEILKRSPNTRFLFVGDELHQGGSGSIECKRELESMVESLNLREHCLFVGNKTDVENYYIACDLTVLPSLFEGTPNVALESMACGVPVVATRVSDNDYVIPDGRVGYLVPCRDEKLLADRVSRLLQDSEERVKMGQNARAWMLQEFTTRRLAEKTASVYEESLKRR
jgi:glycosyltransferase involved in cell wall biosynthesis